MRDYERLGRRSYGWVCVTEPGNKGHGRCDAYSEGCNLPLEVNEESIRAPPPNDLDGVFTDAREMKSHAPPPDRREWEPISWG